MNNLVEKYNPIYSIKKINSWSSFKLRSSSLRNYYKIRPMSSKFSKPDYFQEGQTKFKENYEVKKECFNKQIDLNNRLSQPKLNVRRNGFKTSFVK